MGFLHIAIEIVMLLLLTMRFRIYHMQHWPLRLTEYFDKIENGSLFVIHLSLFFNYSAKMGWKKGVGLGRIARLLVEISLYMEMALVSRYFVGDWPIIFLKKRLKWAGSLKPSS